MKTYETYIAIIIGTHRVISLCGQKHHTRKNTNTQKEVVQIKTERNKISQARVQHKNESN